MRRVVKWLVRSARWLKVKSCLILGLLTAILLLLFMHSKETAVYTSPFNESLCSRYEAYCDKFARGIKHTDSKSHFLNKTNKALGYIVATRYYEQQSMALRSLLQLQCFGGSYGLQTVEPFFIRSLLGMPFDSLVNGDQPLTFGDIFDVDLWNSQTTELGYPRMATWKAFLKSAPKKVIVVCIKYRKPQGHPPHIRAPSPGFNFRTGCPQECYHKFNTSLRFLAKYGFKLVQKSCANFIDHGGTVTSDSFIENLLGKYKASKVTILLNEFRGFFGVYRLPVLSGCGIVHHDPNITILPSTRIMEDAKYYTATMLHNHPYIGILVRFEKLVLQHYDIGKCTRQLVDLLTNLSSLHKMENNYFVAMDIGKFGSRGTTTANMLQFGKQVFAAVYKEDWSFQEWEKSFELYSSNSEVAYVANLQRTIASRSKCMIGIGGGQFQEQALKLYKMFHPDHRSQCIHVLCAPPIEDW